MRKVRKIRQGDVLFSLTSRGGKSAAMSCVNYCTLLYQFCSCTGYKTELMLEKRRLWRLLSNGCAGNTHHYWPKKGVFCYNLTSSHKTKADHDGQCRVIHVIIFTSSNSVWMMSLLGKGLHFGMPMNNFQIYASLPGWMGCWEEYQRMSKKFSLESQTFMWVTLNVTHKRVSPFLSLQSSHTWRSCWIVHWLISLSTFSLVHPAFCSWGAIGFLGESPFLPSLHALYLSHQDFLSLLVSRRRRLHARMHSVQSL